MAAPIGSLVASLQLESAAFIRDLGKAAASVSANTSRMTRSFDGIQRAAKAALGGYLGVQGVRALANIAQAAVNTGDEIGEASSKLGIGAEALQRLRFAAAQTDVDVTALNVAMKQFQKNLATGVITATTGDISGAFEEWIGKIREAPTQLEKVELAVKAFAKQYQAALLIAAQGDTFTDAMKHSFAIPQEAINAASDLDNKLRAIRNAAEVGFNTGFLEAFVGKLEVSQEQLDNLNSAMRTLGGIVATIALGASRLISTVADFLSNHPEIKRFLDTRFDFEGATQVDTGVQLGKGTVIGQGVRPGTQSAAQQREMAAGWTTTSTALDTNTAAYHSNADALDAQKKAMEGAAIAFRELAAESNKLWDDTRTPMEEYSHSVERLNVLLGEHAISAETFARAHQQLTLGMAANWLGAASAVSGALMSIFKDNKAFAIADAIINTAAAVVSALKNPPGPPFSYVYAAAAAATGAAQIATILSTQPGSSAKSTALKKGASAATATTSAASASGSAKAGPTQVVTIKIEGDVFGPEHFRKIVAGINSVQRDGTPLLQVA